MSYQKMIEGFFQQHDVPAQNSFVSDILCYTTEPDILPIFLKFLYSDTNLRFTILTDLFAVDFPQRKERFEVVYSLLSLKLNKRVIIKTNIKDGCSLSSIHSIYPAACWYEREAFDMFGIRFEGASDHRRILTDYGFVGHPLRKDFPLSGHLQVKYDEKLGKVVYEPVLLEQEFRDFDFASAWLGPNEIKLPCDEKATK